MGRIAGRGAAAAVLACLGLAVLPGLARAQAPVRDFRSDHRFGIGYSGSAPDALAGAGVWYLNGPRRLGVFFEGRTTLPAPSRHANYCPAALPRCEREWVQQNRDDHFLRDHEEWLAFNAGALYAVSREFALKVGAGVGRLRQVTEFIDDSELVEDRLTLEGNYFVPFDEATKLQAVIGGILRAGDRIAFSIGYETALKGMSVGAFVMLP
jgi:hypothetical protein